MVGQQLPQHLDALQRANEVRLARSALKRRVTSGEVAVREVLADVPPEAENMEAIDLLMAQHRWGRTRSRRLLGELGIGEHRLLGALTERQRRALASRMPVPLVQAA
jgi:hypothetical protein